MPKKRNEYKRSKYTLDDAKKQILELDRAWSEISQRLNLQGSDIGQAVKRLNELEKSRNGRVEAIEQARIDKLNERVARLESQKPSATEPAPGFNVEAALDLFWTTISQTRSPDQAMRTVLAAAYVGRLNLK